MMITNFKKQKPQLYEERIQKLIDSAGETQFKNIFTKMKDEIKNTIITKLLSKLEKQTKQIEQYKQEIISLKNDLTYILKRILLLKNQIPKNKTNLNKTIKTSSNSRNNIFIEINKTDTNSQLFNLDYSSAKVLTETNLKSEGSDTPVNRINNYLNSIHKKNLIRNKTGIGNNFLLSKNNNLYNEIFSNRKNISEEKRKNKSYKKTNCNYRKNIFINGKNELTKCNKEKTQQIKVFTGGSLNRNKKNDIKNIKVFKRKSKIVTNDDYLSSQGIDFGNIFEKEKKRKNIEVYGSPYLTNKF